MGVHATVRAVGNLDPSRHRFPETIALSFRGLFVFSQVFGRPAFFFANFCDVVAIVDVGRKAGRAGSMLDFEGSNDENLARFYMSFGSQEMKYATVRINRLPWYVKWLKRG